MPGKSTVRRKYSRSEIRGNDKDGRQPGVLGIRCAVCLAAFLLCAGYKLIFPAAASELGTKLCRAIDRDGEYVAVLEELGEDIAKGEDIRAVFGTVTDMVFPKSE